MIIILRRGVIILGNGSATCLGILTSLRLVNIPVFVVSTNLKGLCIYSKYAPFKIFPDPTNNPDKYVELLTYLAKNNKKDILIPTSDTAVEIISKNKEFLEKYFSVPVPEWSVVEKCLIKEKTYEIAKDIKIPIPKTLKVENMGQIKRISKEVDYPCIIKPSFHKMKQFFEKKVIEVNCEERLTQICKYLVQHQCYPLVQEIIPGPPSNLYTLGSVLDCESDPVGVFSGRKIRQIPYNYGVCTLGESLWIPEIVKLGLRLLKKIGYMGISQVEFKLDPRDKQYKLMEINPRPWLWISLSTYCGINLPYILYKMINLNKCSPIIFKDGIKWHFLFSDFILLIQQIIKKEPLFHFSDYFRSFFGSRIFATFSLNDISPFKKQIDNTVNSLAMRIYKTFLEV